MPRMPPHLIPVQGGVGSRGGSTTGCAQVGVGWAGWPVKLFLQGGTGIGGRQWFCKAFGHMTQGLGVDRFVASSVGLCGPNWLKVGVSWPGRTDF